MVSPTNLFYSVVNKFLFKYYEPSNNDSSDDPDDARKIYFRLQYFGHQSEKNEIRNAKCFNEPCTIRQICIHFI